MVKLKLNGNDLTLIKHLIDDSELAIYDKDFNLIIRCLLVEIAEKFHKKSFWLDRKVSISLTPAQAIAFKIHFSMLKMIAMPYEDTLIKTLVAQVDKALINGIRYDRH